MMKSFPSSRLPVSLPDADVGYSGPQSGPVRSRAVLLLGADYYGTLAAARSFGKAGFVVTMADSRRDARGLYSKYVTKREVHPSAPRELVDWLVAWGTENPGNLLYPPNDHLAWLFAAERERLSKVFLILSPSEEAVFTLLDKKRLHDACASVGIDVPDTQTEAAPSPGAGAMSFPRLVKPRTQVFLTSGIKGFIAHDARELEVEARRFRELVTFDPVLAERHPDIAEPMFQEYLPAAETSIFSVSGFASADGTVVARGAMKVLQRPRKVGIGLCFEGRRLEHGEEKLVDKITALCKAVGYVGAFESEFIVDGERRLLIDFNPRFYSQMGFDIARGLPLPLLIWHSARGDAPALAAELARARAWEPSGREVYCHKTMLDLVLGLQRLSGQMTPSDVRHWREWYRTHEETVTDAVRDREDKMPAVVDALQWVRHFAKHPRSFVRSFILNR